MGDHKVIMWPLEGYCRAILKLSFLNNLTIRYKMAFRITCFCIMDSLSGA